MKNVLMIAYAFPPLNFSGTARPFGFARYLPQYGYRPTVLTREGTGRRAADYEMLSELGAECDIVRVTPGDGDDWAGWVKRRLGWLDLPCRMLGLGAHRFTEGFAWRAGNLWSGLPEHVHWTWPALKAGLKLLKTRRFDLIWATGDPWSSLLAGYWLSKWSGLPMVADIRDPWTYGVLWNPPTRRVAEWHRKWERKILTHSRRTVFTSPLTRDVYRSRVGADVASRIVAVTNGFEDFDGPANRIVSADRCSFCFVGNLTAYRNPEVLIEGMKRACRTIGEEMELHFVGEADRYEKDIDQTGVRHTPPISQNQSRRVMRGADVLVLLQTITGPGNDVISGKAYEYLSAGRPILGVVPEDGGDAWLIRETQAGVVTGVDDPDRVAEGILHFWRLWKEKKLVSPVKPETIGRFNRRYLTRELAELFDEVLREQGAVR